MKFSITASTTAIQLSAAVHAAIEKGFTHANDGTNVIPLAKMTVTKLGDYTFGIRLKGRPFEERPLVKGENPSEAIKKNSKTPKVLKRKPKKPSKAKKPAKAKEGPAGSGFIALIDDLLTDTGGEKVDGFLRSKYSVDEALKEVMKKFPDKQPNSAKKIIKVRPRHLERRKDGVYDDKAKRAPRWAVVGPGKNGSMSEIDTLWQKGKSAKDIVEFLVTTRGRDPVKAKEIVVERIERLQIRKKLLDRQQKAIQGG